MTSDASYLSYKTYFSATSRLVVTGTLKSTGLGWQINKSNILDPGIGIEFIKPQERLRVFRALELSVWPRDL